jgi:hypothetical protein
VDATVICYAVRTDCRAIGSFEMIIDLTSAGALGVSLALADKLIE